jgi:hypothetical protein
VGKTLYTAEAHLSGGRDEGHVARRRKIEPGQTSIDAKLTANGKPVD